MNFYFLNDKVTRMKKVIKIKGRLGYIFNGNSIRVDYGRHMLKELGCTKWGGTQWRRGCRLLAYLIGSQQQDKVG